ncbi:MAG: hypothetical protein OXK76_11445 [Gammaproteobacteria bacterium]|nr:hypothetical protein [Gammaproteobacteria bacterium]
MSEGILTYVELDWKTTRVAAAAQRVRLTLARSSLGIAGSILLSYALRAARQMRNAIETADVRSNDDRASMAQIATILGQHAALLDAACDQVALASLTWLERKVLDRAKRLYDEMEEIAETAALASSASFAQLVEQDLRESLVEAEPDQGS